MIKDLILSLDNTPEELWEIMRNNMHDNYKPAMAGICCNYINGKYINITGLSDIDKPKLNEKYSLNEIIKRFKPESLSEIALCMELYNHLIFNYHEHVESEKENDIEQIFSSKFKQIAKYKDISSLLSDSRGWIVWRYQLFNILSLVIESSKKIDVYIQGLNSKKSEIIEELQNLKINDISVYDIIQDLSLPTSFMTYTYPNLRDSLIINKELKLF